MHRGRTLHAVRDQCHLHADRELPLAQRNTMRWAMSVRLTFLISPHAHPFLLAPFSPFPPLPLLPFLSRTADSPRPLSFSGKQLHRTCNSKHRPAHQALRDRRRPVRRPSTRRLLHPDASVQRPMHRHSVLGHGDPHDHHDTAPHDADPASV